MTAADLLAGLRSRGFQVRLAEGKLFVSPGSRLTDPDRAALALYREAIINIPGAVAAHAPAASCAFCGGVLVRVEGWPAPGASAWLCGHCAARSVPTLAEVYSGLTAAEREQLQAEADAGDRLGQTVVADMAEAGALGVCEPIPCCAACRTSGSATGAPRADAAPRPITEGRLQRAHPGAPRAGG